MSERTGRVLLVIAAFTQVLVTVVASDATVPAWLLVAVLLALGGTVMFYRARVAQLSAERRTLEPSTQAMIDRIDGLLRALPDERIPCPWTIADAYNRLLDDAFAGQTFATFSGQSHPVPPKMERHSFPGQASISAAEAEALIWELRAKLAPGHPPAPDIAG
jgi:hypothetical protein